MKLVHFSLCSIPLLLLAACSSTSGGNDDRGGPPATVPSFEAASFSRPLNIDNPYFPLIPGRSSIHFGGTEAGPELIVVQVLDETRHVEGVEARVVRDRVFVGGLLREDTHDWYAQDDDGNVWYLGEAVDDYEYDADENLLLTSHDGSWEAGQDIAGTGTLARPGYNMLAAPNVGAHYHQEYYPGLAEDAAEILGIGVEVQAFGRRHLTLKTKDYSTSDPTILGLKHYASGLGLVLETDLDGKDPVSWVGTFDEKISAPAFDPARFGRSTNIDHPLLPLRPGTQMVYRAETEEGLEEVLYEVLPETRVVAGVTCVVVRDRVTVDGVLVEDTYDWFAQDDLGNVWYLGEAVDDYVYDAEGTLLEVTHQGSWEAGQDLLGQGAPAQPGFVMPAEPTVGTMYRQEFYRGEAEDMALVLETDAQVELSDGTVHQGCLVTLDWVPLSPESVELKYYAPGVGQVLSRHIDSDVRVELHSVTP